MKIEDKLPKAEEVMKETFLEVLGEDFEDIFSGDEIDTINSSIIAYTKLVLDVVAESGNIKTDEIRHALQLIEERIDKENYNTDLKEAWNLISYQLTAIEDHLKSILRFKELLK